MRRHLRWGRPTAAAALATSALLTAGCGGGSDAAPAARPTVDASASAQGASITGTITVLAAASLQESFTTLAQAFEAAHPGTTVRFSFGGSSDLAAQITQGATADVFAAASATTMDQVVKAGDASEPTTFARNVMEIAVPADNPAHVTSLADLARAGVKVALCQPDVPCGATAEKVFANAHVTVTPVTREQDVKATLTKVSLGEVDAGVVYVTDVRAAGSKVRGIEIPANINASTSYPIARLTASKHRATADAFVLYVLSAKGRETLAAAGFAGP